MSRLTVRSLLALVALALMVALPAVASAKRHSSGHAKSAKRADRNRDGLPDRWERRHHLSLKVKQASRDQDRDGSNNAMEFAANTNPRDRDSDDDGVKDGDENVGTVTSFTDGVLVISSGGLPVSGKVTDDDRDPLRRLRPRRPRRHDEGDDHHGDRHGFAPRPRRRRLSRTRATTTARSTSTTAPWAACRPAAASPRRGGLPTTGGLPGMPARRICTVADLKPGTIVREAELKLTAAGPVWDEMKIVPAAVPAA